MIFIVSKILTNAIPTPCYASMLSSWRELMKKAYSLQICLPCYWHVDRIISLECGKEARWSLLAENGSLADVIFIVPKLLLYFRALNRSCDQDVVSIINSKEGGPLRWEHHVDLIEGGERNHPYVFVCKNHVVVAKRSSVHCFLFPYTRTVILCPKFGLESERE